KLVASQVGRPDDGTDPTGFYNVEFSIPLRPEQEWPMAKTQEGWRAWFQGSRARTKPELIKEMNEQLSRYLIGVDWNFSQYIRDNVMESLSGVKGDNSVKIIGPDLAELEKLAEQVKGRLDGIEGIKEVGIFHIQGQPNLELHPDPDKCARWGVSKADVMAVIQSAAACATWSRRSTTRASSIPMAPSSAPALRRSTASRATGSSPSSSASAAAIWLAPWPKRRRQRRTCSMLPTAPSGPANSRKWKW